MTALRSMLRYVLAHKALLVLFMAGLLVESAYTATAPLSLKYFIDYAFLPKDAAVFGLLFALLVGCGLLSVVAGVAGDYSLAKIGEKSVLRLRTQLFGHMLRQGPDFYRTFDMGALTTRLSSDVSLIDRAISGALPTALKSGFAVIIGLVLLIQLEWRLTLAMIAGSALLFLSPSLLRRPAEKASEQYRKEQDGFLNTIDESLKGQSVIKGFHLQRRFMDKAERQLRALYESGLRVSFLFSLLQRVPMSAMLLLNGILIGLGGYMIFADGWTVGSFIAFYTIAAGVGHNVYALSALLPSLLEAEVTFKRIRDVLDYETPVREPAGPVPLRSLNERLRLDNVTFGYAPGSAALRDVSIDIPAKGYTAFVGPSGSGKSTALQLLLRFYDPGRGTVTWDGTDLRQAGEADFRGRTGIVFQESLLFQGTIRDNIRLTNPDATDADVERAAREARIHDTVMRMPDGYDTAIDGFGSSLSGGQRQRIAIARALVRNPELLVLDEATSALDPATEAELNDVIWNYRGRSTIVSVTHRLSSVVRADRIVVFRNGEVAETGIHAELMEKNGLYRAMWDKQQGFQLSEDGFRAKVDAARLARLPVFADIDKEQLEQIAPLFVTETYERGQTVIRENEEGDKLYIIARGVVEVVKEAGLQSPQRVAVLDDGDHFGEIALLRNIPRTATIVALTSSVLLSLRRDELYRLTARFPLLLQKLERTVNERL
ncbi:ABC transporter transmembrane domain-containing protein [Paenibacillus sp. GYB003]|uniref:ABC transporter transmembrane domain-containing protein n=1 Tax=Paenibacillus sp. GYB003 TaxID=2994392 RepID=UPI002F967E9C